MKKTVIGLAVLTPLLFHPGLANEAKAGDPLLGTLLGAAAGGYGGSHIGKGRGRLAATAGGALLGAFLGHSLSQPGYSRPAYGQRRVYRHGYYAPPPVYRPRPYTYRVEPHPSRVRIYRPAYGGYVPTGTYYEYDRGYDDEARYTDGYGYQQAALPSAPEAPYPPEPAPLPRAADPQYDELPAESLARPLPSKDYLYDVRVTKLDGYSHPHFSNNGQGHHDPETEFTFDDSLARSDVLRHGTDEHGRHCHGYYEYGDPLGNDKDADGKVYVRECR